MPVSSNNKYTYVASTFLIIYQATLESFHGRNLGAARALARLQIMMRNAPLDDEANFR